MTEQVIYELGLRDKLTAGVRGADSAVNSLERSLFSVKGLLTGIGVGLAAFKLGEFISEANEEWDKMEFAMSQVQAGIKSTGGAAGVTFDELKKGAEETSHNLKFTQSELLGMQSVLLTFPAVTKEVFGQATDVILDMSTRLGTDLKSSAIQVGKALQDPERGITALRKAGVNFTKDQQELIKSLVNTNRAAEAQVLIINELKTEFGGSALAAAEADKSFRLDKTMEENKVILGEFVDQIKEEMMPVLISIANAFKNMIVWVKQNWVTIKQITIALGAAWIAVKAFAAAPAIFLALENAMVAAAVSGASFGTAITAAIGPVALLAAGIYGLLEAYRQFQTSTSVREKYLADVAKDEEDFVQQGMEKYKGQKNARELAMADEAAAIENSRKNITSALQEEMDLRDKLFRKAKGNVQSLSYDEKQALSMASGNVETLQRDMDVLDARKKGLNSLMPTKNGAKSVAAGGKIITDPKTKATGAKSVTINVVIQKLGETTINTTNIREGAKQLHDVVVKALTGAVNDFQIVASNT